MCSVASQLDLIINGDKCEYLVFTPRSNKIVTSCCIAGMTVLPQPEVRYLGPIFDERGHWKQHREVLQAKVGRAYGETKLMLRSVGHHGVDRSLQIFDSLVSSIISFAFPVWGMNSSLAKFDSVSAGF